MERRPVQIWCDSFPVVSETFVIAEARELARLGHPVEVVAGRRPERPAGGAEGVRVRYLSEESFSERLRSVSRLSPRAVGRDLRLRQHLRREEPVAPLAVVAPAALASSGVVHAHFAGAAALSAMRAARVAGRPFTLTAHAYDVYQEPRNLALKLRAAALVTSGCDYTVRDLRRIAGPEHAERVVRVVMGVDPERFARRSPHPAERHVLAVGRLVEKKGFVHLVRAAADPALAGLLDRLTIAGDGPLRAELVREVERLGLGGVVELTGERGHDEVRELMERAAVLAVPSVVARDGDRDSMPVVAKEALAMEVPVVASDEVGLPELIRPDFGRLVPPGDAAGLARALAELLALAPEERAAMGRAGRAFVTEHANVHRETARLSELLEGLRRRPGSIASL
ncbi:MAG TPA: glycosyltransferase [Thermoleophilaceae bacterium]